MKRALIFTCEHGGARVPPQYRALFAGRTARRALHSHRGHDRGALGLARALSRDFEAPLHASTVTRLLVDLNRSVGHPDLFSELTKSLSPEERQVLLDAHYFPHRNRIEGWIDAKVRRRHQVVHIGVHSFAPRAKGKSRQADVGLLYDPARTLEKELCTKWKKMLRVTDPSLRVRRNYPFLGKADGLVTHLRDVFEPMQYVGIELEASQALLATARGRHRATSSIAKSLRLSV